MLEMVIASPALSRLPPAKLLEQIVLLLVREGGAATCLPSLVYETRKHRTQVVWPQGGDSLLISLQPLLGGGKTAPPRNLCGKIDVPPFRMTFWSEQSLKTGKECFDKGAHIPVSLRSKSQIRSTEHVSECDSF